MCILPPACCLPARPQASPPTTNLVFPPTCTCRGYEGDGRTCSANPAALAQLEGLYWSEPEGLACDAGYDVAWPTSAPGGWVARGGGVD